MTFCEDCVIPKKTVKIFPNSKPWVSKQLKNLLNKKRKAFQEGNLAELNLLKREIKNEIKKAKMNYKEKLENDLANNRLGSAWNGLKTIVGSETQSNKKVALAGFDSNQLANEFNRFYLRFDCFDFSDEILNLKNKLSCPGHAPFDVLSVAKSFKHSKVGKSPGPDNISG